MSIETAEVIVTVPNVDLTSDRGLRAINYAAVEEVQDRARRNFYCNETCAEWDGQDDCDGTCSIGDFRVDNIRVLDPIAESQIVDVTSAISVEAEDLIVVPLTDREDSFYVAIQYHV